MSLIDFIRTVEESQDEFDVELEEFDADSEQDDVSDDASSGGRSYGRLFLVALLLVGVAYVVYRLRSSSGDESFTDIALDEEGDTDEDATVSVEHDPETESTDDEDESDVTADDETESDDEGAVEVEIESLDDESDDDEE